jgi:hypothetical protein
MNHLQEVSQAQAKPIHHQEGGVPADRWQFCGAWWTMKKL